MGISNRLWYLVAETDLTGLWAVPKAEALSAITRGRARLMRFQRRCLCWLLFALGHKWLTLPVFTVRMVRALVLSYWLRIHGSSFCSSVRISTS